jgi:hypothetical protein
MESSCELGNEISGSIECWESTEWLHKLWPLVWFPAPKNWLVSTTGTKSQNTSIIDIAVKASQTTVVFEL